MGVQRPTRALRGVKALRISWEKVRRGLSPHTVGILCSSYFTGFGDDSASHPSTPSLSLSLSRWPHSVCGSATPSVCVEDLRNNFSKDIRTFVQHGSRLLEELVKARPTSQSSEKVQKLHQYVQEGHNAVLYMNKCHDTDHVPSAASLKSLEDTVIRVQKAGKALQVGNGKENNCFDAENGMIPPKQYNV